MHSCELNPFMHSFMWCLYTCTCALPGHWGHISGTISLYGSVEFRKGVHSPLGASLIALISEWWCGYLPISARVWLDMVVQSHLYWSEKQRTSWYVARCEIPIQTIVIVWHVFFERLDWPEAHIVLLVTQAWDHRAVYSVFQCDRWCRRMKNMGLN